ncbi:MAG: hypothetical protein AB9903_12920 [Vulcanimicrobiota bacterium]
MTSDEDTIQQQQPASRFNSWEEVALALALCYTPEERLRMYEKRKREGVKQKLDREMG